MQIDGWTEIAEGYRERMRRLCLFEPLFELGRSQQKDANGEPIDMQGLGFLTLLFFFEYKLMRNPKAGKLELSSYFQEVTRAQYMLTSSQCDSIAQKVIETFRPSDGRKRVSTFFNWETKHQETLTYSLLRDHGFEASTNRQFYTLDEDGLELIFATKEFYSEYQLSISQLMIRKQLEKGEYKSALRQINEMQMSVETLRERILKLKHEIMRNIVSEETFERYKALLGDIHTRLANENEEFMELKNFVQETRKRLFEKDVHMKEPKVYSYVLEITMELEHVHNDHSDLLIEATNLITETLVAAQNSLYYMGIEAFNFEQDLVLPVINAPKSLEQMKGILHPFLGLPQVELWSPLTVLQEQSLREDREETQDEMFLEIADGLGNSEDQLRLTNDFTRYVELLLQSLNEGKTTLEEFVTWLNDHDQSHILNNPTFYHFWLYSHQRSPISFQQEQNAGSEDHVTIYDAFRKLGDSRLVMTELKNTVQVTKRYAIQNMLVEVISEVIVNENQ